MTSKTKKFLIDLAERAFWTAAEVVVAAISVDQLDLPDGWMPLVATGLALVKGVVAKHVGSPNTAALLPAAPDTDKG